MLKKVTLIALVGALSFLVSQNAYSQSCGGNIAYDNDCGSNGRNYVASCCPSGYRVQGVAYNDMRSSGNNDRADAVSAVCRSISKGNIMMPTDFQTTPITLQCDPTEVMAGINCNDLKGEDSLDGCTVYCQKPGSTNLRTVGNNGDTGGNGASHTVYLPQRVVGVLYKDLDKGANQSSDRADCATIATK